MDVTCGDEDIKAFHRMLKDRIVVKNFHYQKSLEILCKKN